MSREGHTEHNFVFRVGVDSIHSNYVSLEQAYDLNLNISQNKTRQSASVCICHGACCNLHFNESGAWTSAEVNSNCENVTKNPLQWRHNTLDGVSNHRRLHCLLKRLFMCRSKKKQSSASLTYVRGIHRWSVDSPNKGPVMRKFPFDDVIMCISWPKCNLSRSGSFMPCLYTKRIIFSSVNIHHYLNTQ